MTDEVARDQPKAIRANPTPYARLNTVLAELVANVQAILGSNLIGFYLQGSFAVGDFDEHSDLDFIAVIRQALSAAQVSALRVLHHDIYYQPITWAQHLEGSYFPQAMLRDYHQSGRDLWYVDHGSQELERSTHCNTIVVRWTLREYGIPLVGPEAATLIDPIPTAALRQEVLATINDWGQDILTHADHYNNRFYQAFIVLNYCRMLQTIHTGTLTSKRAGAEWFKATMDPSWSDLVDRAWSGRPDPARSVYTRADPVDFARTLTFLEYAITAANDTMAVESPEA